MFDGVFSWLEVGRGRPQLNPAVVYFSYRWLLESPVAALGPHHARHSAGRGEQANAGRERGDVALREPSRARGAFLVEVRRAHRALDVLQLCRVEAAGDLLAIAIEELHDEADCLAVAEGHDHRATDLDGVVAFVHLVGHAVRVRHVERLRGNVEYDRSEFHGHEYIARPLLRGIFYNVLKWIIVEKRCDTLAYNETAHLAVGFLNNVKARPPKRKALNRDGRKGDNMLGKKMVAAAVSAIMVCSLSFPSLAFASVKVDETELAQGQNAVGGGTATLAGSSLDMAGVVAETFYADEDLSVNFNGGNDIEDAVIAGRRQLR